MADSRRTIKCDLVLESAIVQHESGTLWCLNIMVWSLAGLLLLIWYMSAGFVDVYRVPGVSRSQLARRVWNRPESAFMTLPVLTESGVQWPVLDETHVPDFIRGFQVDEGAEGVDLDVD